MPDGDTTGTLRRVDDVLVLLATIGALAATLSVTAWSGVRLRRRGVGSGLMGPVDEIYNPAAHRSRMEIQVQESRMAPMAPAAGDEDDPRPRIRATSDGYRDAGQRSGLQTWGKARTRKLPRHFPSRN